MGLLHFIFIVSFISVVHLADLAEPPSGSVNFTAIRWNQPPGLKFKSREDSVTISCQTDNSYAHVVLSKRETSTDPWINCLEKLTLKHRLTVLGQTFVIKQLTIRDSGYYKCTAYWKGTTKELVKGQLVVNPVKVQRTPEIFPNDPIIWIDFEENKNISCHSIGSPGSPSFLTWYQRNRKGKLVKVDPSKTASTTKIAYGNNINIETLVFESFRERDVGDYVCERKVGENGTPTRATARIEGGPQFEYRTKKWFIVGGVPVKMALVNGIVFISCQTNARVVNVTLLRRTKKTQPWVTVNITQDYGRVMQVGQSFVIKALSHRDSAFYKCHAVNHRNQTVELLKGRLIASYVNGSGPPDILPKSQTIQIEKNGAKTIVCQTDSIAGNDISFLTWYRKNASNAYVYVNQKLVSKEKAFVKGSYRDNLTLNFKSFTDDDVGEYFCVRKVSGRKPTISSIKLELKN